MLGSVCIYFYCCVTINSFSISYSETSLMKAPFFYECKAYAKQFAVLKAIGLNMPKEDTRLIDATLRT